MPHSQRWIYRLFMVFLALLTLSIAGAVFNLQVYLLQFPTRPISLGVWLPRLELVMLTGLIASSIAIFSTRHPLNKVMRFSLLSWLLYILVLLFLPITVVVITQDADSLSVISSLLMITETLILLAIAGSMIYRLERDDAPLLVWCAGLIVYALAGILAEPLQTALALPLMIAALGFWLMGRFSNIRPAWAQLGTWVIAVWLTIAGVLLSVNTLDLPAPLRTFSAGFVLLAYGVYAAHCYRALSDRNDNRSLSAHWFTLALLLLLIGNGLIAGLGSTSALVRASALPDLGRYLVYFAGIAFSLGMINQVVAAWREDNRRITGLIPFWLMAGGVLIGCVAFTSAEVVRVYAVDVFSVAEAIVRTEMVVFYRWWNIGNGMLLAGIIIYILGFWARRIRPSITERAARADRAKFEAALSKVADVAPEAHDKL